MDSQDAAKRALTTHDALREANAVEPQSGPDGMPYNSAAWLKWQDEIYLPAYSQWQAAMDALDVALGEKVGRHPFTFRPLCREIIAG